MAVLRVRLRALRGTTVPRTSRRGMGLAPDTRSIRHERPDHSAVLGVDGPTATARLLIRFMIFRSWPMMFALSRSQSASQG